MAAEQRRVVHEAAIWTGDLAEAIVDSLPEHFAVLNEEGIVVATNLAWRTFSAANGGDPVGSGVGANYLEVCDAADGASEVAAGLRELLRGDGRQFVYDYPCHGPGVRRWFRMIAQRIDADDVARVVVRHADVSEVRHAQDQADLRSRQLDEVPIPVIGMDAASRIVEWNRSAEKLYEWRRDEALGRNVIELLGPTYEPPPGTSELRPSGEGSSGDMVVARRDGTRFLTHVRQSAVTDGDGTTAGYVAVSFDTTKRLEAEREQRSAQRYLETVTDAMCEGLCTLDHEGRLVHMNGAAETLLGWSLEHLVGQVLPPIIRPWSDGPGRPSIETLITRARAEATTLRMDDDVFVQADGSLVPVEYTVSSFVAADGEPGTVLVFSAVAERNAERERLAAELQSQQWVTRIQDALAQDRFRIYAQPILDLRTGSVVQHELLIRMVDPAGRLILPGEFLPSAERHGIVSEIDRWVVKQAADLASHGQAVEINLSAVSIGDPEIAAFVERAFTEAGADPANVVIEVPETVILRDEDAGRRFLTRLTDIGCKVALEDFAMGYSNFTYLKRLSVDFLTINMEFVRDLPNQPVNQQVVLAIVQLAVGLGKRTIAKGVEDAETLALLRDFGVDFAQGYAIGRPAPLDDQPALRLTTHTVAHG